jgi:hypothetical protein
MIPRFSPLKRAALAALVLTAAAAPALAQMGPPPPGGMMMIVKHRGPPSPEMEKQMAERKAQMAKDMHTVLRLRPDQEAAWQAFEAAMAPPERHGAPDKPPVAGGAIQHMEMMGKHMEAMSARHSKMQAAVRTFHAALSPDQQQVFDALVRLRGGPGGHGRKGEGGPRMMMGGPGHR